MRASPQRSRRILVVVVLVIVVGISALLYMRSRDDDGPSAAQVAEQRSDCARLQTLRSLLSDPAVVPSPAVPARQERLEALVQSVGTGDELVGSAPSKVRDEVRAIVVAVRNQTADPSAMRSHAFFDARQRLASFLDDPRSGCQAGSESGDG